MNPLKVFLENLQKRTTATVTALLAGVAIILAQFGLVIPEEFKEQVTVYAGILGSIMVMFTGFFSKPKETLGND